MVMGFRSLQRNVFILLFCFSNGWAVGRKSREKKIKNTNNKNLYVSWIFIYWTMKHNYINIRSSQVLKMIRDARLKKDMSYNQNYSKENFS